jgi:hypothetical protein
MLAASIGYGDGWRGRFFVGLVSCLLTRIKNRLLSIKIALSDFLAVK